MTLRLFPPAYVFVDGTTAVPVAGGSVEFDETGTSVNKNVEDENGTSLGDTLTLDINGRFDGPDPFGIDEGLYRVTVKDGAASPVVVDGWPKDNVRGGLIESTNLNYNQGGTGAVDRTQEAQNQDIVSVKDFGATGDNVTDDTAAIQAAIDHCEFVVQDPSTAFNILRCSLYFPPGRYSHTGLTIAASDGGLRVYGAGMAQSVLRYLGNATGIQVGVAGSNVNHIWIEDLALWGDETIQASSEGIRFDNCIRASGLRRVVVRSFNIGVKLVDCFTFSLVDNHVHRCLTNLVNWQNANAAEIRGGRYDDCNGPELISISGSGADNQTRTFTITNGVFQQSDSRAIKFTDMTSVHLDGSYFEGNDRDDNQVADIDFIQGASTRQKGLLSLDNCYFSPTPEVYTGNHFAINTDGVRYVVARTCHTGSSEYTQFANVDADCQRVDINGCQFADMTASSAVAAASGDTEIIEEWIELGASDVLTRRISRGGHHTSEAITAAGATSTTANISHYNMTGNGVTLTIRDEQALPHHMITVFKHTATGQLTVDSEGAFVFNLAGSTNNTIVLNGAVGIIQIIFDGTDWVCFPLNGAWALAA